MSEATAAAAAPSIEIEVTHVEMRRRPEDLSVRPPRDGLLVLRARRPTVSFYRYLYNTVGGPWLWYVRRSLDDEQIREIVQDERVEVHVLYADGVPAGYVELDGRTPPDLEIAYFGLVPEFLGQRLGPYLLDVAVDRAWSLAPERLWLHTCTLDHPRALDVYRNAGFVPYRTERKTIADPRASGLF